MLENTVQKGYIVDINPFTLGLVRKVLVGTTHIFIPTYGWVNRKFIEENYKIFMLPKKVKTPDWDWDEWWEKNWNEPSWAWTHMYKMPRFTASRIVDGAIFAA